MRSLRLHGTIIAGLMLLTVLFTYPMGLHLTSHIPYHKYLEPSAGDHWFFLWAFGFVERSIGDRHPWSFFTDMLFYPRGLDLTVPLVFGIGLPLALSVPFVHVLGAVPTYNLFILGAFVLTAYTMFLLVRYLTDDRRAALVAAVAFAFCPYHMIRATGHFNLATSGMWLALYVLLFIKAMRRGQTRHLLLAPLILALTFAANPYYAVFLGVFSIVYAGYHGFAAGAPGVAGLVRRLLPMGALTVLLLLPFAWLLMTHGQQDSQLSVPIAESSRWGADLLAFFIPSGHHSLWGHLVRPFYQHVAGVSRNDTEQTVYIGYVVLSLSCLAVIRVPKADARFWLLSALIFFGLALGPILYVNGEDTLRVNNLEFFLPLPNYLLYLIPGFNAVRVPSRFSIMLMLMLAVLAGYGTKYLLSRVGGRPGVAALCLGLIVTGIAVDFLTAPLFLVDARVPPVYEQIAKRDTTAGTLLDVPLLWVLSKQQYYQATHGKRLILGQVPRLPTALFTTYADAVPLMPLFKNPARISEYEGVAPDRREILRFIAFFDLSWIVVHKQYLAPEVYARFVRFLHSHFPIAQEIEGDGLLALQVAREAWTPDELVEAEGYFFDFGAPVPQFFLTEGYFPPEQWGELTVVWSAGKASKLWVYLPRVGDFTMELRLLPFSFPGSPPQSVAVLANGQPVGEIALATTAWHSYTVRISGAYLRPGINRFHFRYRYTASPANVIPGQQDPRELAVAFDFVRFRPE